jgi:hypothetical protein
MSHHHRDADRHLAHELFLDYLAQLSLCDLHVKTSLNMYTNLLVYSTELLADLRQTLSLVGCVTFLSDSAPGRVIISHLGVCNGPWSQASKVLIGSSSKKAGT